MSQQEEHASQIGGNEDTSKLTQDNTEGASAAPSAPAPTQDSSATAASAAAAAAAPASIITKPAALTKENLDTLDTAVERKPDDDLSLIVHVDESQNDLDNDILDTPAKSREGSQVADTTQAPGASGSSSSPASAGDPASITQPMEHTTKAAEDCKKSEAPAAAATVSTTSTKGEQQAPADHKAEDKKDIDQSKAARLVCICQSL